MNKIKKSVVSLMGIGAVLAPGFGGIVSAAETLPGGVGSSNLNIEIEATNISMTVPTDVNFVFKADGTNVTPTMSVYNNSIGKVNLKTVQFNKVASTSWQLVDYTTFKKNDRTKDDHKLGLEITPAGADAVAVTPNSGNGTATLNKTIEANETSEETGTKQDFTFNVKRGAYTQAKTSEKAFDMVLNFEFV